MTELADEVKRLRLTMCLLAGRKDLVCNECQKEDPTNWDCTMGVIIGFCAKCWTKIHKDGENE